MNTITKKKLQIEGMHCSSCAMNIDFDLEEVEGVSSVYTSYAKQECDIEYDEGIVSLEKIFNQIEKTGYKVIKKS